MISNLLKYGLFYQGFETFWNSQDKETSLDILERFIPEEKN